MEIRSSHVQRSSNWSGTTAVEVNNEFDLPFVRSIHPNVKAGHLGKMDGKRCMLTLEVSDSISTDLQIQIIERVGQYLSFLIAKDEVNVALGTQFLDAIVDEITVRPGPAVSGHLSILASRPFSPTKDDFSSVYYSDLLEFFYDGLRANSSKAQFFHWFLILESLEHTKRYEVLFKRDKLFTQQEKAVLKTFSVTLSEVKKAAVLQCLGRTAKSRETKLHLLLADIGVKEYKYALTNRIVDEALIATFIAARNRLFHFSEDISQDLVVTLFAITQQVVHLAVRDPALFA